MKRAIVGGCALGLATGWNIANTGAVATVLADRYDVGLAVVGLLTTALFATHIAVQIPGGRWSDRYGARRTGVVGLAFIIVFAGLSMAAPEIWLALTARAFTGIGTGLGFIAGSAYIRAMGGSPAAQGLFGGFGLAGGGLALAIVPQTESWLGWRASYATAVAVALLALVLVLLSPRDTPRPLPRREGGSTVLRDSQLYRVAALYSASLGLSVAIGNWVVTLLDRHGGVDKGAAGAIAALTLALGVFTRPLGGWILREHPERIRLAVGASLAGGAAGSILLAIALPPAVAVLGAVLVGAAAGIPFSPAFTGAALLRPDAPAAAVGFVNGTAGGAILVLTPLLGLTFSLPGDGRMGFVIAAALWLAALAVLPSSRQFGVRSKSG